MKKYITYIGILAIGLLLGWFVFGNSTNKTASMGQGEMHNHEEATETNQMWTCSMHPQIMLPEPGGCPICGMDLIPAASGADGLAADQFKLTKNAIALANIQTSIAGINSIAGRGIKLSGKITANEDKTATQSAHFNGRIEKLYINSIGERVKIGQAIAQVYSPELVAAQQELITAYSIRASQPKLYKAVRNKFKNWNIHGSQLTAIETTGKVKTRFTIYSYVSGVVSEIVVNKGDHIMDGHPIFKVANLTTVWANFDAYENQISQLKKGQEIIVKTNAYPNKKFKVKISFIAPILNTKTRTVTVRAVLNNKKDEFKPGMFIEGKIAGVAANNATMLSIPSSAVLWTGERSVVYVKPNPNESIFEMREVTLGTNLGENYQVLEGLINGDEIVTNGTFTVDAAAQLQGKKSMMSKNGRRTMTGHEGHFGMEMSATNTMMHKEDGKTMMGHEEHSGREMSSTNRMMTDHSKMKERVKVSANFQKQLKKVFDNYISLKDELIKDNKNTVAVNANSILKNLSEVDMKLLTNNEAHKHWMTLQKEIKSSAKSISNSSGIKEQRNHFKHLSSYLTTAVEIFGINQKVYRQFCPMADSNKGAYWLSKEEKVVNPYFGQAMLTCGSVKETIE